LPLIRAIGKEILRVRPLTTIGVPHYTTADVIYKDYFIPKDTVVSINQYYIQTDPSRWSNPEVFDPARFLAYPEKAGVYANAADPYKRDHFAFGAGRRICPGAHLAENSLFITLAKILWAFNIMPGLDGNGDEIPVDISDEAYEPGGNTVLKPYKIRFVPRSEHRTEVVRREWEGAQLEGFKLGNVQVDVHGMLVA
jgi:hypothetical protein